MAAEKGQYWWFYDFGARRWDVLHVGAVGECTVSGWSIGKEAPVQMQKERLIRRAKPPRVVVPLYDPS